ncbi:MAG TPA: serine hydrolase [Anaerolineaceae bacterium]|nr:serine hydrolase [Anaerolineaceae bacterium]
MGLRYAFYYRQAGDPVFAANAERFASASIIKVPILLAWLHLERAGQVDRFECCDLDREPVVKGAGYSWKLAQRRLPYHDVLLMMIALSDNLCTNAVIERIGLERLNAVIHGPLGLAHSAVERKLMDFAARQRGLDNYIGAADAVRLYTLVKGLPADERTWVEGLLSACQDDTLLKRNVPRDRVRFFHKTGSIPGVLHDWGYTQRCEMFLLTNGVTDEARVVAVFGALGEALAEGVTEDEDE